MNKTTIAFLLVLGLGLGFLVARFIPATPVVVAAPKATVVEAPAPVVKAKTVVAPRAIEAPVAVEKSDEEIAKEENRARMKAFGEETKKMIEEIAGGDQAKIQRAMMTGMMKPEGQAIMKEWREFGESMRNATPADREAITQRATSLRDRTMSALRNEIAAQGTAAPAQDGSPFTPPAAGGATPGGQPAPVIIM